MLLLTARRNVINTFFSINKIIITSFLITHDELDPVTIILEFVLDIVEL